MPSQTASEKPSASDKPPANIRKPTLRRGKVRVAALMEAAETVFAERGYDGASMTEIAATARASIGSLYQFFPTKELLAAALHAELLHSLSALLDDLRTAHAAPSAADLADAMLEGLSAFILDHPAFVVLAERRDVDQVRKQMTRTQLLRQIAALLTGATPPMPQDRADIMAIIILQLMKDALRISGTQDGPTCALVMQELRQMLRTHLQS